MGRLLSLDKIPARLKKQVAWWVLQGRARVLGFQRDGLQRVEEYLCVSLGLQAPRYTQPLQRPKHYFGGLTAQPWYDPAGFEWTARLEEGYETIRGELSRVCALGYLQPHHQGLADRGRWDVYYLYYLGRRVEENRRRCPQTAQIVDAIPQIASTGLVYFSVLTAGTHIAPHNGPINTRLRCHLGLFVPQDCCMRVGVETRSWEEGKCLIFDDSFEHEVWNSSQETRIVLVLDIWHPDLTPAETWALDQIIGVSAEARRFFKAVRKNTERATLEYTSDGRKLAT